MLTRKHFQTIAAIIKDSLAVKPNRIEFQAGWLSASENIGECLVGFMCDTHTNFDEVKFRKAAGLPPAE